MARLKRPAKVHGASKRGLSTSTPKTRKRIEEDLEEDLEGDREEDVQGSDAESLPSTSKKSRSITKRKTRKSTSPRAVSVSPPPISSVGSTPQPIPGPKRKGGNKRKWTHEYCLTCTRYGRACGGRREGEEGCAVCRDPDKAKGEKLRECLWADHGAGVTDYKTAREVFKKAQAELRAQRVKPAGKRKQLSQAVASSDPLPETSRPLNLLPPARKQSSYLSDNFGHDNNNDHDGFMVGGPHFAANGVPGEDLPRIHRPQLTYVRHDSDDENKYVVMSNIMESARHKQHHAGIINPQQRGCPPLYYESASSLRMKSKHPSAPHYGTSLHYAHQYRSPYDTVPSLPPSSVYRGQPMPSYARAAASGSLIAPTSPTAQSAITGKPGTSPRAWSREGSRMPTISGHNSEVKSWKPKDSPSNGQGLSRTNNAHHPIKSSSNISDSSSLSSYMSMNEVDIDDTPARLGRHGHAASNLDATVVTRPYLDLRNPIAGYVTVSGKEGSNKQPTTLTLPGEITIQEDEEMGSSGSDSELTSDEGKLKTLPSKLKKVLSRSRITKVIIGSEVFEIRPKTNIVASRVQKSVPKGAARMYTGSRGRGRIQPPNGELKASLANHESDSDDFEELQGSNVPDSHTGETAPKVPLKIKLIFNRKAAADTSETSREGANLIAVQHKPVSVSAEPDLQSSDVDLEVN